MSLLLVVGVRMSMVMKLKYLGKVDLIANF